MTAHVLVLPVSLHIKWLLSGGSYMEIKSRSSNISYNEPKLIIRKSNPKVQFSL